MPPADDLLTSTQAGILLGKSGRTIVRLMEAGHIEAAMKLPGSTGAFLFHRADVERLAEEQVAAELPRTKRPHAA